MLVQIMPNQISQHWPQIERAINESGPAEAWGDHERNANYLKGLLTGRMQAWAGFGYNPQGEAVLIGVVITAINPDSMIGGKTLEIRTLFGVQAIADELYREGLVTLQKFASANGCQHMTAITEFQRVIDVVRMLGGEARFTLISLPVQAADSTLIPINGGAQHVIGR